MDDPDKQNALEQLLALSFDEPAHRPEFYRVLLQSTVYVIGKPSEGTEGEGRLRDGRALSIGTSQTSEGRTLIPFYTSVDELTRSVDFLVDYIGIDARHLFALTLGALLVLNPRSRFARLFAPSEIDALLRTGLHHVGQRTAARPQTCRLTSPPTPYPAKMVDSLIIYFSSRPEVKFAYLAMKQGAGDDTPHLVVGIDGEGDLNAIIQQAGGIALDTLPEELTEVGVFDIRDIPAETADYFLRQTEPFYEKGWGARLTGRAGSA